MDNADYLGNELDWIIEELGKYRDALKAGDADTLEGTAARRPRTQGGNRYRMEALTIATAAPYEVLFGRRPVGSGGRTDEQGCARQARRDRVGRYCI